MIRGGFGKGLVVFNVAVYVFLLAPIIVIVVSSIGSTGFLRFPPEGFTFRWYGQALFDPKYAQSLYVSVWVGAVTALMATLVGGSAAVALTRGRLSGKSAVSSLLMSPLVLPTLVLGVAMLLLVSKLRINGTIWPLVAAHLVITIPYVLRTLVPILEHLDPALEEASADLGASRMSTFWHVTVPQVRTGVAAGALLAFVISFDEVVLALFLTPPGTQTLPMTIYSVVQFALDPTVAAVASLLLVFTAIVMVTASKLIGLKRLI